MDVFRRKVKRLQCGGFGSVRIWTGSFGGVRVSAEKRRAAHDGLVADGDVEFGLGRDGAFEVGYLADSQDGSTDGRQGARLTYQTSLEQFRVELCYTQARAITLRCTSVNEGTVRHRQSKEASILRSHHEETRELRGERDSARNNNARCTQARKATHGLGGQHQDVDRTLCGRVNQNDRGQEKMEKVRP